MEQAPASSTLSKVTRLRRVLDTIGDALSSAAYDRLVEAEAELAAALPEPVVPRHPAGADPRLAREIQAARIALVRVRRLGASLTDVIRLTLRAQGRDPEYGPHGACPVSDETGSLDRSV